MPDSDHRFPVSNRQGEELINRSNEANCPWRSVAENANLSDADPTNPEVRLIRQPSCAGTSRFLGFRIRDPRLRLRECYGYGQ